MKHPLASGGTNERWMPVLEPRQPPEDAEARKFPCLSKEPSSTFLPHPVLFLKALPTNFLAELLTVQRSTMAALPKGMVASWTTGSLLRGRRNASLRGIRSAHGFLCACLLAEYSDPAKGDVFRLSPVFRTDALGVDPRLLSLCYGKFVERL